MSSTQFHITADGGRIAYRLAPGKGPTLVFLPGYMSDMTGGKAAAIFDWALANGQSCLLLDYSGCGESGGEFANGTLTRWGEEVLDLIHAQTSGEVILIGSSMGGWLMVLAGLALGNRLAGLIGIAAAPDFTEWGTAECDKVELAAGKTVYQDNAYGPEPTPTHPGFWADGQARRVLGGTIELHCPVRLLHGQQDPDVPWEISLRLSEMLRSSDVQVILIKDGDHRLSRDGDIAILIDTLGRMLDATD